MLQVDLPPEPLKYQLSALPVQFRDFWETSDLRRIMRLYPDLFEYGWVAGGAVRRAVLGTESEATLQSDIDFFFSTSGFCDEWDKACRRLGMGDTMKEKTHAREYTFRPSPLSRRVKLQAIRGRWFATSRALLNDFDYAHCQFAIGGDWLTIGQTSVSSAQRKRLEIVNARAPVAAIRRIVKYEREGFKITDTQLKKLLRAVTNDPSTIDTPLLEEYVDG